MKNILILIIVILISSCGASEQEKAIEQKRITDSIVNVGAQQVKDSIKSEDYKAELQKAIQIYEELIPELTTEISGIKAQLQAEYVKMEDIQQYKVLRSKDQKEIEVYNQSLVIQDLEKQLLEKNTELNKANIELERLSNL